MSKFKQSSITPEQRGKVGNIVFSKNRYGPYNTLKRNPTNRKTDAQMRVRYQMRDLAKIYSNKLNKQQYQGWKKLVPIMKRTDTSGNKYKLAPRDIFVAFNFNLTEVGLPVRLDAPAKLSVQLFSSFKFEVISDNGQKDIRLFFKPEISEDTRIMLSATRTLSNSLNFFRDNRFKKIGYLDRSFKSGDSIFSKYLSISYFKDNFDSEGAFQIAFRLKPVSALSGFSKDFIEASAEYYLNI